MIVLAEDSQNQGVQKDFGALKENFQKYKSLYVNEFFFFRKRRLFECFMNNVKFYFKIIVC